MPEEKRTDVPPPAPAAEAPAPTTAPAAPPTETAPVSEDWGTRFKYLLADFENFRKRAAKEYESTRQLARADMIRMLLPTYEAAQRAREAVAKMPSTDPIRRGVDLLAREFSAFLEVEHVTPVARLGESFRAEWHEAVAEAPARDRVPDGTVLEIVQQGYRIDGTLVRPAKVVVARRPAPVGRSEVSAAAEDPGPADSSL